MLTYITGNNRARVIHVGEALALQAKHIFQAPQVKHE